MRDFIQKVKTEALIQGGKVWQFFSGCINRAENFLGSAWKVQTEKTTELIDTLSSEIFYRVYPFSDIREKMDRYEQKKDEIISEINYILLHEGIKDWSVFKTSNKVFNGQIIHFAIIRPAKTFTIGISIKKVTEIIGQILSLEGFFITDIVIFKDGKWLYNAWHDPPTSTEIFEIQNLMPFSERENTIEDVVEKEIKNIAKNEKEEIEKKQEGFFEKLKNGINFLIIILLIGYITYIVSVWTKTGEFFKKGLDILGKKEQK